MSRVLIEISLGELIDRISILQLKAEHATNPAQRAAIEHELHALLGLRAKAPASTELSALSEKLAVVNRQLWDAEDEVRLCQGRGEFGPVFVQLARSICRYNDRRCELRRRIDALVGTSPAGDKIYRSAS